MEKLIKYKKYLESASNNITPEEKDQRIKEIISNTLKTKHYFEMLKDSIDYVFKLFYKQMPANSDSFINEINSRDNMLSEILDDLIISIDTSSMADDIEDIIDNLNLLEEYTKDNMDMILSGQMKLSGNVDDDEDEDEDEEDDVVGGVDNVEYEEEDDDDIEIINNNFEEINTSNKKNDVDEEEMNQLKPKIK